MPDEIKYALGGLFFTWDDEKAVANWRKHKVAGSTSGTLGLLEALERFIQRGFLDAEFLSQRR